MAAVFRYGMLAQDSPHGPLSIPCTDCHTTASWKELLAPMKFDHSTTAFVLRGQHRTVKCAACHATLRFKGTSADCNACHKKNYDGAQLIDHRKAGFSTDCLLCHTGDAESWSENFDHNRTQFPTRGAHDAVACSQCHVQNKYRGTPVQCVACHQKDYDAARVPDHRVARFSVECATCHRALTWQPAVFFPHESYFPIAAGANHSPGVWNTCSDCHVNQSVYAAFECINCHRHSKSRMDSAHEGRRGYEYLSSACYRCHPRGEAG
jgi:hypothetical protein